MKRIALFLLLLGAAGISSAATQNVTFAVQGWTCGSCAASTRIALKKLGGIQDVKVDTERSEASVIYDDATISPDKMIQAVEGLGYKANVKTTGAKIASTATGGLLAEEAATKASTVSGPPVVSSERITFFEVPLECPAVPGLGCGGRARPLFADLERNSLIAGAWLNHSGNVLGIIWKVPDDARSGVDAVQSIFRKSSLEVLLLRGSGYERALKDFSSGSKWYRGTELARLSEEEAEAIASRLIHRVEKRVAIQPEKAAKLRKEVADVFKRHFAAPASGGGKTLRKQELLDVARKTLNAQQAVEFEKALAQGTRPLSDDAG